MQRFDHEINLIMNPDIKSFVQSAILQAPSYFWTITSSTSGKHHPPDERGPGGRVLHTKRVVRLCAALARTFDLDSTQSDCLIAAAIIHDLVVNGLDANPMDHNWKAHDVAVVSYLKDLAYGIDHYWTEISAACSGHMGKWGSCESMRPKPGDLGYLLHIADVISSHSWVLVEPL